MSTTLSSPGEAEAETRGAGPLDSEQASEALRLALLVSSAFYWVQHFPPSLQEIKCPMISCLHLCPAKFAECLPEGPPET